MVQAAVIQRFPFPPPPQLNPKYICKERKLHKGNWIKSDNMLSLSEPHKSSICIAIVKLVVPTLLCCNNYTSLYSLVQQKALVFYPFDCGRLYTAKLQIE